MQDISTVLFPVPTLHCHNQELGGFVATPWAGPPAAGAAFGKIEITYPFGPFSAQKPGWNPWSMRVRSS